MYVEADVIGAAATLIRAEIDNGLAVQEEADWRGFNTEDAAALRAVLDEVNWGDLCVALRRAADRLPERGDPDGEDGPADGDGPGVEGTPTSGGRSTAGR